MAPTSDVAIAPVGLLAEFSSHRRQLSEHCRFRATAGVIRAGRSAFLLLLHCVEAVAP